MKFLADLNRSYNVVFGIDASTHTIGVAVLDGETPKSLIRISLTDKEVYKRIRDLRLRMEVLTDIYHPQFVMIESPIMVQNPLTTKNLSYVAGIIISLFLDKDILVQEVSPIHWKTWLGYNRITKKMRVDMIERLGVTEGEKAIKKLKKSQIQDILIARYPHLEPQLQDDNLADSLGIALYALDWVKEQNNANKI